MSMPGSRLFIGVDAGGTRTRAVCVSEEGVILGAGVAGPANHASGELAAARASIGEAIARAAASYVEGGVVPVAATFIGSAGLEHVGDEAEGRRLLDDRIASREVFLDTDAYVAWAGAFRCRPGIVIIAGTGSMCLGIDAGGMRAKVGGWGWRVGDEGSAYGIAVDAVRAALQTVDGRLDAWRLWEAVEGFVDGASSDGAVGALAVRSWLYDPRRSPADIAAFAPFVERAATSGCTVAAAILRRAGTELAKMAAAVAATLAPSPPLPIATLGGVMEGNAFVRSAFEEAIADVPGIAGIVVPAYEPHIGAALLAMRAHRGAVGAEVFARLDAWNERLVRGR